MSLGDWLADRLTQRAAARLGRRHPEWARAILSEHACMEAHERLTWAVGVFWASLVEPVADPLYPAALSLAIGAMGLYQWSADEGIVTLMVLGALGGGLGFLRPQHFLLSGLVVGAVVAAVIGFECLSGIRPAYELQPRTLGNCLHWLILVIPGLLSSAAGRQVRLKLLR